MRLGGLLVISGAFGMFRRDLVVEVGGLDHDTIGEDAELVVRLHRHLRRTKGDYRVVFVAEPVSWSEAPSTAKVLGRQRRRWHRGITEILWKHRAMVGNPRDRELRLPAADRPLAGDGGMGRDQEETPGVGCDDAHRLP